MTQLQISIPESTSRFIEEQVASGRYGSPSEVVVDLLEKARAEAAKDRLADLILDGENSGEGAEFTKERWEKRRADLMAEAERRRSA